MGGAVSSGQDNNELIDNLVGGGYIRTRSVERVFRVLDRADYMTPTERDQAYKDLAWRSGALHLSAPCIYSEVVEALKLKPGLSFLNLGSGTGYLSTLVGLLIGSGGTSHGVEMHPGVVEYSTKKLSQFQENSVTLDEFDFCIPKYYCGNALCLAPLQTQYDRVYVGAGVLPKYENYFKQLIKVKGVLVMPLGDTLVQIQRVSETEWHSRQLLNVSFALLRAPTKEESAEPLKLDELVPASLMLLSRAAIRRAMLSGVCRRHPELGEPAPRRIVSSRPRPRRICIPLDPDTDNGGLNALHDLEGEEGGREMNALLSLVLNMGNNRGAGSLRLADERPAPHAHNELEVLIDEIEQGSGSDSESSSSSDSSSSTESEPAAARRVGPRPPRPPRPSSPPPAPAAAVEPGVRPSAAGATMPHPDLTALVSGSVSSSPAPYGTSGALVGCAQAAGEASPAASDSGRGALNPAGRVEVEDSEAVRQRRPSGAAPPSTSGAAPPSTSGAAPPSTSGAAPPSTSGAAPPSTSGAAPPSTSGAAPPSTSGAAPGTTSDGSKPSTSGNTPDAPDSALPGHNSGGSSSSGSGGGGPSSGTKRSGGDSGGDSGGRVRRRMRLPACGARRHTHTHKPEMIDQQVQIYFRNAGGYAGSDVVHTEETVPADQREMEPSDQREMDASDQREMDASDQREMDASSSDDDAPACATDKKRQKLDSGIGEGTASSSTSSSTSSTPRSSSSSSSSSGKDNDGDADVDADPSSDNHHSGRARRRAGARSSSGFTGLTRRARRSQRDARRVRLSIAMKRAIKELPLPYALKKYVNLHRCFEF